MSSIDYRKLWEQANGPIPKDDLGRSYEIHHIDGNRDNNSLENFMCIPIEEHYNIHYEQGDWGACMAISFRMQKSPEEFSKMQSILATAFTKQKVENGTHNFLKQNRKDRIGNEFTSESATVLAKKRSKENKLPAQISAKNGTHHWQTSEHSKRIAESNKKFRNTVTVTDKMGHNQRINKEIFESQKVGETKNWDFVGVASLEAKKRRGEI